MTVLAGDPTLDLGGSGILEPSIVVGDLDSVVLFGNWHLGSLRW